VTFSQNAFYDGQLYLYPDGLNTEFLTYLGLEINPKVTALGGEGRAGAHEGQALSADPRGRGQPRRLHRRIASG
jgi:iron complex transport system substrate-binding protein